MAHWGLKGAYQWLCIFVAVRAGIIVVADCLSQTAPRLALSSTVCRGLINVHFIFQDRSISDGHAGRLKLRVRRCLVHGLVNFFRNARL